MAYIKYKELTRYFNFRERIPNEKVPEYVFQYLEKDELLLAYKVRKDLIIFTNLKIIIFDVRGFSSDNKKIHILPYSSISSSAMEFKSSSISLYLVMDSGYQLKINFVSLSGEDKKLLRIAYSTLMNNTKR